MSITVLISFSLILIGLTVFFWNRQNVIRLFIGAEMCVLGANWLLVFGAQYSSIYELKSFILFVLAVAAVEVAIGLGILMLGSFRVGSVKMNKFNLLLG